MFENVINFFKKIGKKDHIEAKSKDTAKERLHLVLMQDRANVSADFLDMMRQEIIEVIKKYIDVEEKDIDVRLTNKTNEDGTMGAPALYANIPIAGIREEMKKEKNIEKETEEKKKQDKEDKIKTEKNSEEKEVADEENKESLDDKSNDDEQDASLEDESVENETSDEKTEEDDEQEENEDNDEESDEIDDSNDSEEVKEKVSASKSNEE